MKIVIYKALCASKMKYLIIASMIFVSCKQEKNHERYTAKYVDSIYYYTSFSQVREHIHDPCGCARDIEYIKTFRVQCITTKFNQRFERRYDDSSGKWTEWTTFRYESLPMVY